MYRYAGSLTFDSLYLYFDCILFKFYVLIKWEDMSKDSDLSKHGSSYEIFMHRAYGTHNPTKPEMQASVMLNLIMAEKTSQISEDLVTRYEDKLTLMKLYIGKAIDKYIDSPKITKSMAKTLTGYKADLLRAISTDEVMSIVYNINHLKARQSYNSE